MASDLEITLKRYNGNDYDTLKPTTTWTQVENKPTTFTPTAHTHGDISNTGTITATAVTPANTDYILISDTSASGAIERGIQIGTGTTTFLRNDGQWATPAGIDNYVNTTGDTMTGTLNANAGINLNNSDIINVNQLTFNDPGPNEGLIWNQGNLWKFYESPNDLSTNGAGNLQIVQNTTRRATFNTSGQLELPVANGTAPLVITSTTAVSNLNADLLDGQHGSYFLDTSSSSQTKSGNLTVTGNISAGRYYQSANGIPTTNLGGPTVSEMALFEQQFDNKLAFYDITKFTFETYDGTTWTDITSTISDTNKRLLVGGDGTSGIAIPNNTNRYRISIRNAGSYVYLNALYSYMSTNGNSTQIHVWRKRDDGVWTALHQSTNSISSWPGHTYLPFSTIPWSTSLTAGHWNDVRFEFIPTWNNGNGINIYTMELWGGYPAGKRRLFSIDENKNAAFPAALTGTRLFSTIATGTSPLSVTSTTVNTNLNADLLDGYHASSLVLKAGDTMTGNLTMGNNYIYGDLTTTLLRVGSQAEFATVRNIEIRADDDDSSNTEYLKLMAGQNTLQVTSTAGGGTDNSKLTYNSNTVWHAGNDGAGSGLDADLLDGNHASAFYLATNPSGYQTAAQVSASIAALVDSAPGTLDTLNELAAALGDDANFASTVTTALAGKASTVHTHSKSDITDFGHTHGNILNNGSITSTTVTPADQDRILIADNSNSGSIERGIIIGTGTTTFLRNDGQWATPADTTTLTSLGLTATATELNYVDGVTSAIQTQLDGKAATSHTHTASQISDSGNVGRNLLTTSSSTASTLFFKKNPDHTITLEDATTFRSSVGAAASSHTHAISDVTNLQTTLDGKAASSHTHTKSQITDFAHTHPFTDITGTATTSQLPTIPVSKGGTGQTSYSGGGGVMYYNSQSGVISVGGTPSQNNVLMATGYNGTHYFGNWVDISTLTSNMETTTTIASLAANTLSSSYSVTGYRFAHIWLSNTAANTTTTIWQGTIDLSDTNQRGTTTGNQRYQRIVWNNGTSTFADNLEIYSASSTSIQFRHNAGITMRYRIVWEV